MTGRQRQSLFVAAALVLLVSLVLVACGSSKQHPKPEPTTLSLWYYWDSAEARQRLLRLVTEFNVTHDDIQVSARYVTHEDIKKELALAIADGEVPDMAIVDSSDVQYYNNMKPLVDVSGEIDREQYLDEALASCRGENGTLLGLPLGLNCLLFYYNEDILLSKNIKVPENLDEFVAAAVQVTEGNVYGCAFPSLQSEESMYCFLPVLWAKGGRIDKINSEEGRQAFDVLRQLAKKRGMSHSTVNMTLSDISKEFAKENIAMMFATSGMDNQIHKTNPDLDFKVGPLPTGEKKLTVIGGEVLTVLCDENREQAAEFVKFMAEPERIKKYLEDAGYLAPRKDVLSWQIEKYPEQKKYAEYLGEGREREFTPYWPAVSMAVADVINQVILEEDQENTLEELEEKIRAIREAYYEKK